MAKRSALDEIKNFTTKLQGAASAVRNPIGAVATRVVQSPQAQQFARGLYDQSGARQYIGGVRSAVQGIRQGIQNPTPETGRQLLQTYGQARGDVRSGTQKLQLTTAGALSGGAVPAIGFGAGLSGAFAKTQGQDPYYAAGQGAGLGLQSNAVQRLTSPILSQVASRIPLSGKFTQRLPVGVLNAAQGIAQDRITGQQTTPFSIASDAILGAASPVTSRTPQVQTAGLSRKMHPEDAQWLDQSIDLLRSGKTPSQVYKIIDDMAQEYVPRSVIDKFKGNPRKLATWMQKNIAKDVMPQRAFTFPSIGFSDGAKGSVVSRGAFDVNTYLKDLEKQQNSARSTKFQGANQKISDVYAEFKRKIVDSFSPIEDLLSRSEKGGNFSVLPSQDVRLQIDRVLRAPNLAGQFAKDNGMVDLIRQAPDLQALDQYLIAKQARRVADKGITTGRDSIKDAQLIEALGPQYEGFAKQVTGYSQKLLDYTVNSGLISKDLATQLRQEYPEYVPLNRIFDEAEKKVVRAGGKAVASLSKQSVVQKLQGSEREIESPIASLLAKTQQAFEQGEKNQAARMLASYKDLPGFKGVLQEVESGSKAPHTISFLDNGVKRTFSTTPAIEAAAKSLDRQQMGVIGKVFAVPTRGLRLGATGLNIGFTGANVVKDQITNLVLSEKPLQTSLLNPANFVRAVFSAAKHDDLYDEVVRNAAGGTSFDIGREASKIDLQKIRAGKNFKSKIAYTARNPGELLRTVEDLIGRSEEATRIQIYRGTKNALLKEGRTLKDAELLAAKAARDTTTNFARSGDWGRVISWMVPYFNAGVQGSRNLVRNLKDRPLNTSLQLTSSVLLPMSMVTAWNLSDPTRKAAYEDLQEYEKEGNIIIVPPNPTQDEQGRWNVIKVPLPQGISNLASLVRRPLESAQGLDPVRFKEVFSNLVQAGTSVDTSSVGRAVSSFTPQAVKPFIEAQTNTNLFTGRNIVPEYQKNLPPEEQVSRYTSGTARGVGKVFNVSPRQVENAVGTSLGGLGRQILNTSDRVLAATGAIPPEQVGGQAIERSISNRFTSAAGGKQEELAQKRQGQAQYFRKKAIELIVDGKKDEAKKIAQDNGLIITKGDLKRHVSSQKSKAVDLVINGNPEDAKKIAQKYNIKITAKDVRESAKRKAITFIKQGNKEEAQKLREKYKFVLTNSDIR